MFAKKNRSEKDDEALMKQLQNFQDQIKAGRWIMFEREKFENMKSEDCTKFMFVDLV